MMVLSLIGMSVDPLVMWKVIEENKEASMMFLIGMGELEDKRVLGKFGNLGEICNWANNKRLYLIGAASCYLYAEKLSNLTKYDDAIKFYNYALQNLNSLPKGKAMSISFVPSDIIQPIDGLIDADLVVAIKDILKSFGNKNEVKKMYIPAESFNMLISTLKGDIYLGIGRTIYYKTPYNFDLYKVDEVEEFYRSLLKAEEYYNTSLKIYDKTFKNSKITTSPKLAQVYLHLGALYKLLGKFEKADSLYERASEVYRAIITEAEPVVHFKRWELRNYYLDILKTQLNKYNHDYKKLAEAYINLGRISLKNGDIDEANKYYDKAVNICFVHNLDCLYTVLNDYLCYIQEPACKNKGSSLKGSKTIKDTSIYERIGRIYDLGDNERNALHYYAEWADIYLDYDKNPDLEKILRLFAFVDYHRSIFLDIYGTPDVLFDMGRIYDFVKMQDSASYYYEWALSNSPSDTLKAYIYLHIGRDCFVNGDFKCAFTYYNKVLSSYSSLVDSLKLGDAFFGVGRYYEIKKDYDRAIEYYSKAFAIYRSINSDLGDVKRAKVLFRIAEIYDKRRNKEKAREYYRKVFKIYSDRQDYRALQIYDEHLKGDTSEDILSELGYLYFLKAMENMQDGKYGQAFEYYVKFIRTLIKSRSNLLKAPHIIDMLLLLAEKAGKQKEAKRLLKEIRSSIMGSFGESVAAYESLEEVFPQLKEIEGAGIKGKIKSKKAEGEKVKVEGIKEKEIKSEKSKEIEKGSTDYQEFSESFSGETKGSQAPDFSILQVKTYFNACKGGADEESFLYCSKAEKMLLNAGYPYKYALYEVYYKLAELYKKEKDMDKYEKYLLKALYMADSLGVVCLLGEGRRVDDFVNCDRFYLPYNPIYEVSFALASLYYERASKSYESRNYDDVDKYLSLSKKYLRRAMKVATLYITLDIKRWQTLVKIHNLFGQIYYLEALNQNRNPISKDSMPKDIEERWKYLIKRYKAIAVNGQPYIKHALQHLFQSVKYIYINGDKSRLGFETHTLLARSYPMVNASIMLNLPEAICELESPYLSSLTTLNERDKHRIRRIFKRYKMHLRKYKKYGKYGIALALDRDRFENIFLLLSYFYETYPMSYGVKSYVKEVYDIMGYEPSSSKVWVYLPNSIKKDISKHLGLLNDFTKSSKDPLSSVSLPPMRREVARFIDTLAFEIFKSIYYMNRIAETYDTNNIDFIIDLMRRRHMSYEEIMSKKDTLISNLRSYILGLEEGLFDMLQVYFICLRDSMSDSERVLLEKIAVDTLINRVYGNNTDKKDTLLFFNPIYYLRTAIRIGANNLYSTILLGNINDIMNYPFGLFVKPDSEIVMFYVPHFGSSEMVNKLSEFIGENLLEQYLYIDKWLLAHVEMTSTVALLFPYKDAIDTYDTNFKMCSGKLSQPASCYRVIEFYMRLKGYYEEYDQIRRKYEE